MATRRGRTASEMVVTAAEALSRTVLLTKQQRLFDVSDGDVINALGDTRVSVVADEANIGCVGGQSLVTALVGLALCCGMSVRLVLPRGQIISPQPPLHGRELLDALADLGTDSVPEAQVVISSESRPSDLVFVVGDSEWNGDAADAWRLGADDWSGWMNNVRNDTPRLTSEFPIGGLTAGAIAAAEPYKAALRRLVAAGARSYEPTLLDPARRARIALNPPGTPTRFAEVVEADLISGGAITTALLHALLRIPGLRADFRVFEPQVLDGSNLNRYVLMRRSLIGRPKVEMLEKSQVGRVSITGDRRQVDADALGRMKLRDRVVVGTDNVQARWDVQEARPDWLGVGGTAGFMVMVSEHEDGWPCSRCLHAWTEQVPGDVPTVSFVSYWAGLMLAARLLRRSAVGPISLAQQSVEIWPDRLDGELGFQPKRVQRQPDCPLNCSQFDARGGD